MKITHVQTQIVKLPADEPLASGPSSPGTRDIVILTLGTDDGVEGIGMTFFGGGAERRAQGRGGCARRAHGGRGSAAIEAIVGKLRGAASGSGPGRHLHACALADRHRAVGHQGQGVQPAGREAPRRIPRPRADVRERRADARLSAGARGEGGAAARREGLQADEDAARAAGRHQPAKSKSSASGACATRSARTSISCATSTSAGRAPGDPHRQARRGSTTSSGWRT